MSFAGPGAADQDGVALPGDEAAADIAEAQADLRAEEAEGLTIVPFPTPENMDFRPNPRRRP